MSDEDPWVRAQAAQGAESSQVEQLLALARSDGPAFVRASALLGLARLAPKRAAATLGVCGFLVAPELGVRVGALRLVDRANLDCPDHPLEDIVLLDRELTLNDGIV